MLLFLNCVEVRCISLVLVVLVLGVFCRLWKIFLFWFRLELKLV